MPPGDSKREKVEKARTGDALGAFKKEMGEAAVQAVQNVDAVLKTYFASEDGHKDQAVVADLLAEFEAVPEDSGKYAEQKLLAIAGISSVAINIFYKTVFPELTSFLRYAQEHTLPLGHEERDFKKIRLHDHTVRILSRVRTTLMTHTEAILFPKKEDYEKVATQLRPFTEVTHS